MTTLVGINLNKRFNSSIPHQFFENWLAENQARVVCAQEPFLKQPSELKFANYYPIGGNKKVFTWMDYGLIPPKQKLINDFCQKLEFENLLIYNVYLDAYKQTTRAVQLRQINQNIPRETGKPVLIVGDFNISPTPEEGLSSGVPSGFNSEIDRHPLRTIVDSVHLTDVGHSNPPVWTVVRKVKNDLIEYRCDLVLASRFLADRLVFKSDASTRKGAIAFTDHSGLVVKLPFQLGTRAYNSDNSTDSISGTAEQIDLFATDEVRISNSESLIMSGKTAMHRSEPSLPAKIIVEQNLVEGRLFDWGCGHGADLKFFQDSGIEVSGWDPNFLSNKPPSSYPPGNFSWVYCGFVLNTLISPEERKAVIQDIFDFLPTGGHLAISVRSKGEIENVRKPTWKACGDGWVTSKNTFQKGFLAQELSTLLTRNGYVNTRIILDEPIVFIIADKS